MNTPTTNLLDLIRDDAHAAGFQSLGQYRKALIEAATAAATITISETHSPVKVRLGLRLIGDEEVATITLTQHDKTVILHCDDQAHAARIAAAIEALPAAPAVQGEPVAWLYEDELPDNYPYEAMFPYSKVDGVRIFPVYSPQPAEERGKVVVTKDKLGNIVFVTRQDAEGRILSVISESEGTRPDVTQLVEALQAIQKVATHGDTRTGIQAGTALGCIAAVCDVTLAAHREQGGGV